MRLAAAVLCAALVCGAGDAWGFAGVVTRVSDGDTLWVQPEPAARSPVKLRLRGIDAPELCQAWGTQARDALAARVLHRHVTVEVRARDDYGRIVGRLRLEGRDVAAGLVAGGHAWSQRWHGRGPYVAEEEAARSARRGLFADRNAIEPRSFRGRHGPCRRSARPVSRASACSCRTGSRSGRRPPARWRCARRAQG